MRTLLGLEEMLLEALSSFQVGISATPLSISETVKSFFASVVSLTVWNPDKQMVGGRSVLFMHTVYVHVHVLVEYLDKSSDERLPPPYCHVMGGGLSAFATRFRRFH